jgi:hypothetical protein
LSASALAVAARSPAGAACRSAVAKCSLQTTMALVAAPSSTRCRASQPPADYPVAQGEHHPTGGQVGQHEPGHEEMAAGLPALPGRPVVIAGLA